MSPGDFLIFFISSGAWFDLGAALAISAVLGDEAWAKDIHS